jgi:hypothetical protein
MNHSHHDIALASIKCFTDDGNLSLSEFNFLLGLALRDDHVDDEERRVLDNLFARAALLDLAEEVRQRIRWAREKYSI